MRIYISGAITGIDNYEKNFSQVEFILNQAYPEAEILSPPVFCKEAGLTSQNTWEEFMVECRKVLATCSHIHLLEGWAESKGACEEVNLALVLGVATL